MSQHQCNPVQEKISCVYTIAVNNNESSSKRNQQSYKVSATKDLTAKALSDDVASARATEKLDGTCCLVEVFNGQPWLWARLDRKPNKQGERRFAQYKKSLAKFEESGNGQQESFVWSSKDFKEVPDNWIPASRLEIKDGFVVPDSIGHTPGWVPVDVNARQHCWHLSAVDLTQGVALVLREDEDVPEELVIEVQPLSSLCGQTCELIGTNINGNPYGLGSKKSPLHLFVAHGSLSIQSPDVTDYEAMYEWFSSKSASAQVEGVVWHCQNKELHKLHRHHLNLKWPVEVPHLSRRKVKVQLDLSLCEPGSTSPPKGVVNLFALLVNRNEQKFDNMLELCEALNPVIGEGS
ncbi:uncharacterized protein C12orf29 homolog [Aplysia californica]|uniref:RNA ligase 1 n=1 Tax=Aplysia californica TaxID=6500 RepID=A0ABM1VPS9_APLCA|nr:uncharacterized protein C12orf29 homolog [Aplysia californica]XP_005093627.1 uncharacterized protein C12orf29 homolog [Aplysia californica]XP_005093628.1 uncharacterized protein C12orf29 homolog [Aplysia californica]XP_005093629.1 uncharacterized protein C12orf29 homolog [Aplysia californica]XP_005093630.1 uncharacterized protein C12orf29 homolog [Aplysia californica]XP_035824421.1 uncharacterized protein C12orf29 homolog [Aplysia californica]XP_035824422.1 uncharacterized protein C12orf29